MPRRSTRPRAAVPRYTLTRREAAASLGISINHFERKVQPELKVVLSGQLVLIPVAELERWVERHAHQLTQVRSINNHAEVG
jgi:excisionase family DNA binding protein